MTWIALLILFLLCFGFGFFFGVYFTPLKETKIDKEPEYKGKKRKATSPGTDPLKVFLNQEYSNFDET